MPRNHPHIPSRRTGGDVVRGIGALLALAIVLVGIPVALVTVGADPLPNQLPSVDDIVGALTRPDDGSLFLGVLTVIAWAGWATFAVSILLEVPAQIRGIRAPRLPGIGLQQRTAAGLVAAVAVLVTSTATGTAVDLSYAAQSGHAQPHITQSDLTEPAPPVTTDDVAPTRPTPAPETQATDTAAPADDGGDQSGNLSHTVERGDTLWDIADEYYDDPTRWPDIHDASAGTAQPDGRRLTDPDLIVPGWELTIPAAAPAADRANDEPAPPDSGDVTPPSETPDTPESGAGDTADPDKQADIPPVALPDEDSGNTGTISTPDPPPAAQSAATIDDDSDLSALIRTSAGIGVLLAGGIVSLLIARRTQQHRRRRAGQRLPNPTPEAAELETELRATDGPTSADIINRGLRTLAAAAVQQQIPLPQLRAARLTHHQFELILDEPASMPAPFEGTVDQRIWTIPTDSDDLLDAENAHTYPCPYPGLVSIGHDEEDALLLLDLEYLGMLGIYSTDDTAGEILTAIAGEYATSTWADDLQVTLVGDPTHTGVDTTLRTGRIRHVPTLEGILHELEQRATEDRAELGDNNGDVATARSRGEAPDTWPPEIVLVAGATSAADHARLTTIVDQVPRVAIAAVTTDPGPDDEWTVTVDDDHDGGEPNGVLRPLNVTIRPQRVTATGWATIAALLDTAEHDPTGQPGAEIDLDTLTAPTTPAPIADPGAGESVHAGAGAGLLTDDAEQASPVPEPGYLRSLLTPASSWLVSAPTSDTSDEDHHLQADSTSRTEHADTAGRGSGNGTAPATVTPIAKSHDHQAPYIRVLGPVDILGDGLGAPEATKRGQLTRIAAFIAMHPGASTETLDGAIWPGHRQARNTRNTAIAKLRRWLGKTPDGHDWLPRFRHDTGFAYLPGVRTDWDDWCDLLPDGPDDAATENIRTALQLVRGRPFTGRDRLHYDWADRHAQDMICAIVDACHELATRALSAGDPHDARAVIAQGQQLEPGSELLWRDRFKAESLLGDPATVHASADQYRQLSDALGGEPDEDTITLIDQILHHRAAI